MKTQNVMRPEVEIEYKGVIGLFYAIVSIFKLGIIKPVTVWVVPKYTLKKQ